MEFTLTIKAASAAEILRFLGSHDVSITGTTTMTAAAATTAAAAAAAADEAEDNGVNLNPPMVDSKGMPWDERIHSENKKVNNDGTWRKRRGIADSVVAQVEAELRARSVQHQPQFQPQPMQMPQQFQPQPMQMPQQMPVQHQPTETTMDFQSLVSAISAGMQNSTIQQADLMGMFGAVGITNLNEAATNPLVLAACVNYLRNTGKLA